MPADEKPVTQNYLEKQLENIENILTQRMAYSIETLGDIIKEYA